MQCRLALLATRSEEHTSELQSPCNLVCRLLLEKKKKNNTRAADTHQHVYLSRTGVTVAETPLPQLSQWSTDTHVTTRLLVLFCFFFFFNDTATTEIYTLSLHDALPIYRCDPPEVQRSWRGTLREPL